MNLLPKPNTRFTMSSAEAVTEADRKRDVAVEEHTSQHCYEIYTVQHLYCTILILYNDTNITLVHKSQIKVK